MTLTPKAWLDGETGGTPLDAAALRDLETRLAAYADTPDAAAATHAALTTSAHGGVVAATDARLTDARAPTAHQTTHAPGGSDALPVDASAGVGSLRTVGTGALQAASGTDTRLSDARTPVDGSVTAAKIAAALKPSGSAVAATEALRALGTTAATATAGDDARLTDARTPTAHQATHVPGGTDALPVDAGAGVGSLRTLGTGALQATAGTDARLTNARTPTSHKATHAIGGADALTPGDLGFATYVSARPEQYGALRDGREVRDGAMTSGSAILMSETAAFVAGDVDKAIAVAGAGPNASAGVLSTTIASRQSATQVTLSTVALTTVAAKHIVWGTDDTAAIKAAVNAAVAACQADKTYYCEVQFSAGIYITAAAPTMGGATRGNAQIPLPNIEPTVGQKITIVLRGMTDAGAWSHWLQTQPQKSGAVIRSMLVGQTPDATWKSPSVIGTPTVALVSGSDFSNLRVIVDGLTIVAAINPSVVALDLRRAAQADVPNFSALADGTPAELNASATDDNGVGLYMPMFNNNDSCTVGIYGCEGFYYGMGFADHLCATRLGLIYCNTCIFIFTPTGQPVHGAAIMMMSVEAHATIIEKNGTTDNCYPIWIGAVHSETGTGTNFKDASSNLFGYIGFANNQASADPSVTGCANVMIQNVGRPRGALTAPAMPASTVATTPVFRDAAVVVTGGTVSAITVDGAVQGITSGMVLVPCGKTIAVTYSVAPTWKWTLL